MYNNNLTRFASSSLNHDPPKQVRCSGLIPVELRERWPLSPLQPLGSKFGNGRALPGKEPKAHLSCLHSVVVACACGNSQFYFVILVEHPSICQSVLGDLRGARILFSSGGSPSSDLLFGGQRQRLSRAATCASSHGESGQGGIGGAWPCWRIPPTDPLASKGSDGQAPSSGPRTGVVAKEQGRPQRMITKREKRKAVGDIHVELEREFGWRRVFLHRLDCWGSIISRVKSVQGTVSPYKLWGYTYLSHIFMVLKANWLPLWGPVVVAYGVISSNKSSYFACCS